MKKYKTLDGHYVSKIRKDNVDYFLGNRGNYQEDIDTLIKNVSDLRFDSIIIIFGLDTGAYLNDLYNLMCDKNKVVIFEPNKEIFLKNKKISNEKVALVFFEEDKIKNQLYSFINSSSFNNLYVHAFGNYREIYEEEYNFFIETLDCAFHTASSSITISNRFREVFIKNLICNLDIINQSTAINSFEEKNKNVPAFIVSAGPSLEKNIEDMVKNKELVEKSIVVAGSRTLKALLENGIKPDLLVSIDPIDDNYEMMKEYLDCDTPLVFYEYSNRKILSDYKGEKIYLSTLLSKIIEELNTLRGTYLGGSIAHTCVDIARTLGCNPIILVGQDLAYTFNQHHSKSATFKIDNNLNLMASTNVKDVYGNDIKTTATLNQFRKKLEEYIETDTKTNDTKYINASYGADIMGADHLELNEVFKLNIFYNTKECFEASRDINIDSKAIISSILDYIDFSTCKADTGEKICIKLSQCDENKSLVDIDENDEELQKFLEILEIINKFESSPENTFLGGYFNKFIFDIKQLKFNMYAKDYDRLTSNLKYQSQCFLLYFKEMKKMLKEVQQLIIETVTKSNESHNIK
ncbi:motility associated factor glycosyltransferase family protein [Clostridium psychrophilum]|uniref:motility associated factor glycosyltransferase family protein n=1 Tax=Clostridium psychrophilum TaxID=132926 RepID=UPI001C0B98DE|nr:6-hydroxymethylpterin diphosphokinase MptE-like protein [Clostridium psychrophilum]MBU3181564.1 DUF115 domain-containing protein [Clostridium psychrophilum]